ncbi:MAG: carbamoyltransferase HypF [Methanobacteriota archaeon]
MRLRITGVVQGVGFRPTVVRVARAMGINGHVRNDGQGVEIVVDGDYEVFLAGLRKALPPLARIDSVITLKGMPENKGFIILESQTIAGRAEIPPDTAVCPECLREMAESMDRRHGYPFTSCTNCGERFSVIRGTPYDRQRTTMEPFRMCRECGAEYGSDADRRFHHQTVSCPECGPSYAMYGPLGEMLPGDIGAFAKALDSGKFGVLKGWGGAHLCCTAGEAKRFRQWYAREAKPFAVMVRDFDAAKKLFAMGEREEAELQSPSRPVVLLRKKAREEWMEVVAPGLDYVGVMLPYSGVHHIIFENLRADVLIMTSANPPGSPMHLENKEMFGLGADVYLLHNREIANRCDDSVVKLYGPNRFYIRRSRGIVPTSMPVGMRGAVLGVGPGENVTACVASRGILTPSQYIGDASDYDVNEFHRGAIASLMRLRGLEKFDAIAVDMHPRYPTRRVGEELAEAHGAKLVEVQHHWAHALSLMAETRLGRAVVLTIDGTGYGDDGEAWGGEVLLSDARSYKRLGHLECLPLPGGEGSVENPKRFLHGIQCALGLEATALDGVEAAVVEKSFDASPKTSSAGRVLDALSVYLGACSKRTYDGEPAMRLEPLLERGKPNYKFEIEIKDGVVKTLPMFRRLMEMSPKSLSERSNAAASFVRAMIEGLVQVAADGAAKEGLDSIGLSGGVSYSIPVARYFEDAAFAAGLKPLFHDSLPNGDGGISAGQCVAALGALEGR